MKIKSLMQYIKVHVPSRRALLIYILCAILVFSVIIIVRYISIKDIEVWDYDKGFAYELLPVKKPNPHLLSPEGMISLLKIYRPVCEDSERRDEIVSTYDLVVCDLLKETKDKQEIAEFFKKFKRIAEKPDGCEITPDTEAIHIVAYDSVLMRVAYFRYYLCEDKGEVHGIIRTADDKYFYNEVPVYVPDYYHPEEPVLLKPYKESK